MILALETSCDETAAALVSHDGEIRANVIASQADLHAQFGGVVPEIASRRHLELVLPVVRQALSDAGATLDDVDLVAVTRGPGLIGALLVGLSAAKALAWSRRLPLAAVDHLDGHVASLYLEPDSLDPPFLCLLASGGHTMLLDVRARGSFAVAGRDPRRRRRARPSTRARGCSGSATRAAPSSTASRATATPRRSPSPSRSSPASTSPSRGNGTD